MIKLINVFLFILSYNVYASNTLNGSFQATQACTAYASKNNQSSSGNVPIEINKQYPLKEMNQTEPGWLRIEFPDHQLRWVSAGCGIIEYNERNLNGCSNAGMADSYVLALSSQPGFCQTYGLEAGKPECRILAKSSYQANHLTLHGLWPNKNSCGQNYGFCGVNPKNNHCDYIPIDLEEYVAHQLKKIMPSFNYGSCLERHEWNKHGSCQDLSVNDYFSLAMRLTTEMDQSIFGRYLTQHAGQVVMLSSLRHVLDDSFGTKNRNKIYLGCKNNVLVDIFIQLPSFISSDESLDVLIDNAPVKQGHDFCSEQVILSNFNTEALD